jgi:hypothetical protein
MGEGAAIMKAIMWGLAVLSVLATGALLVAWFTSLSREFATRRAEAMATSLPESNVLTEADIAELPEPVRRYIAVSGSLGKPRTVQIEMVIEAEISDAPNAAPMAGPVKLYQRFDQPRRLFLMESWMKGLPVKVLHDFNFDNATMSVRLAGLINVVDLHGEDVTRTETVTILGELCVFAPSLLADPCLSWSEIDATHAGVSFTLGPNTVSAVLTFDQGGDLVDFRSEDRGALQADGSLQLIPWTTPVRNYRDFDGRRIATDAEAIWHYPEGSFTYLRLRIVEYCTN